MRGGDDAACDLVLVGPFRCQCGRASATRKARSGRRSSGGTTRRCRSAPRTGARAAHGRARATAGCCPTCCSAACRSAARRCAGSARTSTTRCGNGPSSGAPGNDTARGSTSRPFAAPLGTAAECSAPAICASLRAAWSGCAWCSSLCAADRAAPDGEPQCYGATWLTGSERPATTRNIAWTAATRRSRPSEPNPGAGHRIA
jgi:hypothetical protein